MLLVGNNVEKPHIQIRGDSFEKAPPYIREKLEPVFRKADQLAAQQGADCGWVLKYTNEPDSSDPQETFVHQLERGFSRSARPLQIMTEGYELSDGKTRYSVAVVDRVSGETSFGAASTILESLSFEVNRETRFTSQREIGSFPGHAIYASTLPFSVPDNDDQTLKMPALVTS